jgi:hypothetical protein
MRTKSPFKFTSISLESSLKKLDVDKLSELLAFKRRRAKKITARHMIQSFFGCSYGNSFSLSQWAASLGLLIKETVSKQALFERVNDRFILLTKALIGKALEKKINQNPKRLMGRFKNVFIQDSSCISLPEALCGDYKGNYSRGRIKSVAKLQLIFNIASGGFKNYELTPYSKNDQAASGDILPFLGKGDLVIRDMGYFVLNVFRSIKQRQAHFISRLRKDVAIYDSRTGKPVKLITLLKNKTFIKRKVLIGCQEKLEVPLMAIKVNDKLAHHRVLKMLKDRDRRKKNTMEKLSLMGWDIFICSMDDLSGQEIKAIYRLRWQIEIIFKSWKSHLRIEKNISPYIKRPYLAEAIIYLTFLMAVLIVMPIYSAILATKGMIQKISLLKITKMIAWFFSTGKLMIINTLENLLYHSFYERRNRTSFGQKINLLT